MSDGQEATNATVRGCGRGGLVFMAGLLPRVIGPKPGTGDFHATTTIVCLLCLLPKSVPQAALYQGRKFHRAKR
jgi:hypothetical protein